MRKAYFYAFYYDTYKGWNHKKLDKTLKLHFLILFGTLFCNFDPISLHQRSLLTGYFDSCIKEHRVSKKGSQQLPDALQLILYSFESDDSLLHVDNIFLFANNPRNFHIRRLLLFVHIYFHEHLEYALR